MTAKYCLARLGGLILGAVWMVVAMCPPAGAEMVDRIVAVVNDEVISFFELNRMLRPYTEKIKTLNYPPEQELLMLRKVRADLLSQMIDQKLTDQETERARIKVSEADVDQAIERIKRSGNYTDQELAEGLRQEGFTVYEYRDRLREQILRAKLVSLRIKSKIVITEDDVMDYYEAHADDFRGGKKYHLRNILMRVSPYAADAEKKAIRQKMTAIRRQISAGKSFESMARKYSQTSLAEEGGDLGVFSFAKLSPQLQKAIKSLKKGQMTSVLDTEQGYQLFYIEEVIDTPEKSLEAAMPEIEEKLFNQIVDERFRSWLSELRENSYIRIME
ncbi:hypothetical protein DENIS_5136 [Desulfonema ishimotonii]|uniref:PpiC domain-containing protein n=2 Tax=Desulfonema ishimotonii TaxID=45657 RepID=A0A401G4F4_9BACT|nr:hypothetical protein DENIS_5136 [Desulfonema ishimotonii]